ncbi:MAG: hypothetical protein AAF830_02585 [Pseudomonadota bacterium]
MFPKIRREHKPFVLTPGFWYHSPMSNSQDSTHLENDAARVERLTQAPCLDPVLKQQLETTLHASYEFNAKYAKYGVVWVWLFWALKWGFAAATAVALLSGIGQLVFVNGYSPWMEWLAAAIGLSLGFGFFSLFHAAVRKAQDTEMKIAKDYRDAMNRPGSVV